MNKFKGQCAQRVFDISIDAAHHTPTAMHSCIFVSRRILAFLEIQSHRTESMNVKHIQIADAGFSPSLSHSPTLCLSLSFDSIAFRLSRKSSYFVENPFIITFVEWKTTKQQNPL